MISKHNLTEWILQAIATDLPFRLWEEWIFNPKYKAIIKYQLRSGEKRKDYQHVYVSLNRPISVVWAPELKNSLIITMESGSQSYVASHEPLAPELLFSFELLPLLDTRADTLLSILSPEDFPLVMAKLDRQGNTLAALASPDPSNPAKWRVTHFGENVGPTGHTEVPDARSAVREMINSGYINLASPSLIDEISTTFT
jgi:hypothetical protein